MRDIEHEIWRDIKGYEGFYRVSNLGRVASVERLVNCGSGKRKEKSRIMAIATGHNGYSLVHLRKNGSSKMVRIHRIVAEVFVENHKGYPDVNHLNGNKKDNRALNLEWCTHQQNVDHSIKVLKNTSSIKPHEPRGVYFFKKTKKWSVRLTVDRKVHCLGYFKNKSEAYKTYFNKFIELRGFEPWDLEKYPTHERSALSGNTTS